MTLREKIEPLLDEFKRANGKGSMAIANIAMIKIIEALVDQLELERHLETDEYDLRSFAPYFSSDEPESEAEPPQDPNMALLQAVHALHEANYVVGTDYTAIVEHLKHSPPEELPIKIRNKPGRKPNPDRSMVKKSTHTKAN